jgi:uncharacterized LabA/DUF88 family protein
MATELTSNTVAVYWDFENLHAALYDREWTGSRSYADPRFRFSQQDALVNIKAVMDYAASIGDIAINRAYNNWQWFSRYRDAFNSAGIDLIQIYPKGQRAKNGADIRLALDALEDLFRYPKLTHVIIISSDSDFISLAQKLKQAGLTVIGIGVQQATNVFWAHNCDEFRYYDTLLSLMGDTERSAPPAGRGEEDEEEPAAKSMSLEDAKTLMLDALRRLMAQKGADSVPRGTLKMMMKRMDSTFDEANLGFFTFSAFIKAFPDIEDISDDSGGRVRLRRVEEQAGVRSSEPAAGAAAPAAPAAEQDYDLILRRGNVRMPPAPCWREAIQVVDEIFREAPGGQLTSFDELESELMMRLDASGQDCDPETARRIRAFLFALWQFQLDKEKHMIGLKSSGSETLLRSVEREIVRRIVKYAAPPIDVAKVAGILYGEDAKRRLPDTQELINDFAEKLV